MIKIKDLIQKWLEGTKKELAENYRRIEPYGIFSRDENWDDLIETNLEESNGNFKAQILGPYYTYWLEHGRGPTKNRTPHNPTVREVVLRWINKYGIVANNPKYNSGTLAYFISKSIHEKGIKVPGKYNPGGLISDVITNEKIDNLIKEIGLFFTQEVKSDVLKTLK